MSKHRDLIEQYRASRAKAADHRLTNSISMAAELILRLKEGYYTREQADDAWEVIEVLIRHYAEGRRDETR